MIVPSPPLKPVNVDDLVINKTYCTKSGAGGTYSLTYLGIIYNEYIFTSNHIDWPGLHLSKELVSLRIYEDHSKMSVEEYEAAGGTY